MPAAGDVGLTGAACRATASDDWRRTVVAILLDVPGPAALCLHHQRQDQRQSTRHDEDDAERVVRHERQIDVERKEQDRADHDQDDANSDTHVFLLLLFLPE